MELLRDATKLAHEFGSDAYVRGGGGNISVKQGEMLWIKPSGLTLAEMQVDSWVALDRGKLSDIYQFQPPPDATQREAAVKDIMTSAVRQESSGRASVETPLHDSLSFNYVVHTHPALVNGMTCAVQGADICRSLFPQALWVAYTDPGYTLSMKVRDEITVYRNYYNSEPEVIFLQNHGIIVGGDTPDEISNTYHKIMNRLKREYQEQETSTDLEISPAPVAMELEAAKAKWRSVLGPNNAAYITGCGPFPLLTGPISPDHIVYSRSYYLMAEPTAEAVAKFVRDHGYTPWVMGNDKAVFAVGATEKKADLALEMAQDGALVMQLARAFGGIHYMTEEAREFIENWEVEAYRSKQL